MHLRVGFWEHLNSISALQHMKYFSFLDIIGFDQSSASDFLGNRVQVVCSVCSAFSIECINIPPPWDHYMS